MTRVEFEVIPAGGAAGALLDDLHRLFAETYRDPSHAYLDRALDRFANLALARVGAEVVGFAVAEMRPLELPRLGVQPAVLAGLCCVDAAYRRQGLFRRLEVQAATAGGAPSGERLLSAGRMAHPVSFRVMSRLPSAVPRPDRPLTEWQKEIGLAIAAALGVARFDPETFVCGGDGTPIGTPVLDMEVTPEEWIVFEHVDRSRGDALLGICWFPEAPPEW